MAPVRIGIVGVGCISGIYLQNITSLYRELELVGVCDLEADKVTAAAAKYPIPKRYATMYELFADPEIDIVLNLTRPYQHYEVSKAALLAGKHVYSEKPLAASLAEGRELVRLAEEKGLLLGGAPDTFLGGAIQTARKYIDAGLIGDIVGVNGNMIGHGTETWHPDPEFFYKPGGGPLFDMGPYYITAFLNLMGGIRSVSCMANISFDRRTITSRPHQGEVITVETPTHINSLLRFESGAIGHLFTTFDCYNLSGFPCIEIFGSEGTMNVPDPNWFCNPVTVRTKAGETLTLEPEFDYTDNSRGLGLADMAKALQTGRTPRCGCQQTLHVLEVMDTLLRSAREGRELPIESRFTRQPPMERPHTPGIFDI